jgi:DHA2 family multidrug resistance protein
MGAILGPIIGPALGGWLTDNLSWRWVFYINLPIGALAFAGLSGFLTETKDAAKPRLDLFGFAMLALAIGSIQLMLDRGQTKDWFSSLEICVEAALGLFFGYLFVVHTLTARKPFIDVGMFKDRNFLTGSIFGFFLGTVLFGVLALLPTMLETLMGYPVVLTGLVTAPRGIGTLVSMIVVGRIIKRVDARLLIFLGFAIAAWSLHMMSGFSLEMGQGPVILSGFIQGIGTGLVFVPLTTIAFATLNPKYRNEGAAMFTLTRNIGSAVGISVLQAMTIRNAATVHSRLVEGVRPDNPALDGGFDFDLPGAVAAMNAQISRQASMVSYVDAFWLLFVLTLVIIPLLLLMRGPRAGAAEGPTIHMD